MSAPNKLFTTNLNSNEPPKIVEKVPEHAKLVYDDEKVSKELMDLKKRLKEVYQ